MKINRAGLAMTLLALCLVTALLGACVPVANNAGPLQVQITGPVQLEQAGQPAAQAPGVARAASNPYAYFEGLNVGKVLDVTGPATFTDDVTIDGTLDAENWTAPGFITSTENLSLTGTLAVGGVTTLTGALAADGGLSVDSTAFTVANTSGNVGTTGTLTAGGAAALNGGITVDTSNFTVSGTTGAVATASSATVGTFLNMTPATSITVTAGSIITPTGTLQPLRSASSVTCSTSTCIAAGTTTGKILVLENKNASDTITIDGTGGTVECKTDKVLGARDTLALVWDGSVWVCLALSDNS